MTEVYLTDEFVLSMLPLWTEGKTGQLCVKRLGIEEAKKLIKNSYECAMKNEVMIRIARNLLQIDEKRCHKRRIWLDPGDTLVVLEPYFTPVDVYDYSYYELLELIKQGRLALWAVYYGSC